MKLTRLMGLIISGVCALISGILVMRFVVPHHVQKDEVEDYSSSIKLVNVLVARSDISTGMAIYPHMLQWVAFPEENVFDGFITELSKPNALNEFNGVLARMPILKGDPIRLERLVGTATKSSGVLASLLPKGKRAFSLEASGATAVSGMIMPDDYVDVLAVSSMSDFGPKSEVVIRNAKVMAIDQNIFADGRQSIAGSTVTLELTIAQVKRLLVAQNSSSRFSLVLRSMSDSRAGLVADDDGDDVSNSIQVIKSGAIARVPWNSGEEMLK